MRPYRSTYSKADPEPEILSVPMGDPKPEKPSKDAIIRVLVKLPIGDVRCEFIKRNIMGNIAASRLTQQEFSRAIQKGLEGLLGGMEVV